MPAQISTVLFDADGVLQYAGPLHARFAQRYGWPEEKVKGFFRYVCYEQVDYNDHDLLTGAADILPALEKALAAWGWTEPVEAFVRDWLAFGAVPDPVAFELVDGLRQAGMVCGLATNQDTLRARYMHEDLGYRERFDLHFYSAMMGCAKPDPVFFDTVLAAVGVAPERVLFIDDREENVAAARGCGLRAEALRPGSRLPHLLAAYDLPV